MLPQNYFAIVLKGMTDILQKSNQRDFDVVYRSPYLVSHVISQRTGFLASFFATSCLFQRGIRYRLQIATFYSGCGKIGRPCG